MAEMNCIVFGVKDVGGAVASWSVHSTPDRVVRVRALAGEIVLCLWVRHNTMPHSASLHPGV